MRVTASKEWRELLQDFADARIDPAELFARAGKLLPPGAEPSEQVLEALAESDFQLRVPAGRQPFVRRLEQFAAGAVSYDELDLWTFVLWQTELLSPYAPPATDPELGLLQNILGWMAGWEEEAERPTPAEAGEFARIVAEENDPRACLERLEEAVERFGRG